MKKLVLGALAAVAALSVAGVASAQPYGYRSGGYYDDGYRHGRDHNRTWDRRYRDSDRDGIPDRREWNRDRDRDGRADQYDRYDNRRHWRGGDRRGHSRYDRYGRGGYGYRW